MRGDSVALIDKTVIPKLLYNPPAGLDVAVIEGDVRVFHVNPEADAICEVLPLLYVLQDVPAATAVELSLAHLTIEQAWHTNLVEENQGRLNHTEHSVTVPMRAFGISRVCLGNMNN